MWRAIPLAKIVLRLTVFGALLGASLGLLSLILFGSTAPAPRSYFNTLIIKGAIIDGVILGGLTGVAMALYAAVVHRSIQKSSHFRFAMLIVATIVSLAVVQHPFHIVTLSEFGIPLVDWVRWALRDGDPVLIPLLFATIAKHLAIGLMSLYVAGLYLRDGGYQFALAEGPAAAQSRDA